MWLQAEYLAKLTNSVIHDDDAKSHVVSSSLNWYPIVIFFSSSSLFSLLNQPKSIKSISLERLIKADWMRNEHLEN